MYFESTNGIKDECKGTVSCDVFLTLLMFLVGFGCYYKRVIKLVLKKSSFARITRCL